MYIKYFAGIAPIRRFFHIVGTVTKIRKFSYQKKQTPKLLRMFWNIISITLQMLYVLKIICCDILRNRRTRWQNLCCHNDSFERCISRPQNVIYSILVVINSSIFHIAFLNVLDYVFHCISISSSV